MANPPPYSWKLPTGRPATIRLLPQQPTLRTHWKGEPPRFYFWSAEWEREFTAHGVPFRRGTGSARDELEIDAWVHHVLVACDTDPAAVVTQRMNWAAVCWLLEPAQEARLRMGESARLLLRERR